MQKNDFQELQGWKDANKKSIIVVTFVDLDNGLHDLYVPRHVVSKYMSTRNDTMIKCFQMSRMAASPVAPL